MSPKQRPFFSVVIPTYNRAPELDRALDSLTTQTFKDFEVIVCDDGSTDNTSEVCRKWSGALNITYLHGPNSGGPARPRNRGVMQATGNWICFLDSDDWWYTHKLERIRGKCEDADIIYHDCHAVTGSGRSKKTIVGRNLHGPVFEDLLVGWNPLITSATCVKKAVLDLSGEFDEDGQLVAVEDFDLWLRIARITQRFVHVPEVLGVYVVAEGNISQYSEKSLARELAVFKRHVHFLEQDKQPIATRMLLYRQGLIYWHLGEGKKSREKFLQALPPKRWRHRLLVLPWIIATFFCKKK